MLAFTLVAGMSAVVYVSFNKQKIIRAITTEMENKINGRVGIGNVELSFFRNFAHISVLFHDMIITDTVYASHRHALFKAKEVFANIHLFRLIRNESPVNLVSQVDFLLRDGALINYEPVKKLQRFVFKKRDFDNIRFAELKNRLEIDNQEIKINRMEIQSTVMSMFVEGIYNQKGGTDISIQVPLSNFKRRRADYNPENIGVDKKGGSSLFIRGRPGDDGRIQFKLDLFRKFAREKKANGKL